jgi:hypothetical protein
LGSFAQHNFGDPLIGYRGAVTNLSTQRWLAAVELAGPRFVDLRGVDFNIASIRGALHPALSAVATNIYCIFKPEDAKLAQRLVDVGVVTDFRLAPPELEESSKESEVFAPQALTPVDVDQCVLEELLSKLPEKDIPKAWELYEDIKTR